MLSALGEVGVYPCGIVVIVVVVVAERFTEGFSQLMYFKFRLFTYLMAHTGQWAQNHFPQDRSRTDVTRG